MKTVSTVLAGLIIWCGVLTGVVIVQYQEAQRLRFDLSVQSRDIGLLRAQILVRSIRLGSVQNKDRARERELERLVFKLIDALTQQPDDKDKPSAYDKSMDNSWNNRYEVFGDLTLAGPPTIIPTTADDFRQ